jgi:hypothetical protein
MWSTLRNGEKSQIKQPVIGSEGDGKMVADRSGCLSQLGQPATWHLLQLLSSRDSLAAVTPSKGSTYLMLPSLQQQYRRYACDRCGS